MGIARAGRFPGIASLATCALLAVAFLSPTASAQVAGELQFNQKFKGLISSAFDEDVVAFDEAQGSKLTITVVRAGANQLKPSLELLDQSMQPIDTSSKMTQKSAEARIKEFKAPYSGTYHVRVRTANNLTGTYQLTVKGNTKKKLTKSGTISLAGEQDSVAFHARAGAKISGSVKRKNGEVIPFIIELAGPDGNLVSINSKVSQSADGSKVTFKNVKLPTLGQYELRFTGQSGTVGDYRAKINIEDPDKITGKVFEDEFPTTPDNDQPNIKLKDVSYGRGLRTASGEELEVVSPLSLVQSDPISDLPIDGTLAPLYSGVDLSQLVDFNLNPLYVPPVVPRNGVLVLRFDHSIDVASLNLVNGRELGPDSPIRLTVNGVTVASEALVDGKRLTLNPVVGDQVGFPPSPLVFDAGGNPVAQVDGAGKLEILSAGPNVLKANNGGVYAMRGDQLASPESEGGIPLGFNPGNVALDFFQQTSVGVDGQSFGGFLPDMTQPRLIRELAVRDDYAPDFAAPQLGDLQGSTTFSVVSDVAYDTSFNDGKGEWAGAVLRIRPAGPSSEEHVVLRNTVVDLGDELFRNEFKLASPINVPMASGEPYEVVRAEFFEPDLSNPLDPSLFDPTNPEIQNNTDLMNFVVALDRDGNSQDVSELIDPLSTFTFLFSEPMQRESFRPYESFFVTSDPPSINPGINIVARVTSADGGKRITYRPERIIQFGPQAGTVESTGFGAAPQPLRFHIQVVPSADILEGLLGEAGVSEFLRLGDRGVTDVGGQPLAFPLSFVSAANPIVDYSFAFATFGDSELPEMGAIVHRFQGAPNTGFDAAGNTGVTFRDMPEENCGPLGNLYGPRIADVNLFTNGFLSGAPVQFFQKIHDNFNPPPTGSLAPFPFGTSTPLGGFAVLGGARFMHVYRAVDASPDWEALGGTLLDLYQVAWAPIGGGVTPTTIPDISIHAGHTAVVPDTKQSIGIPQLGDTGLPTGAGTSNVMGGHFETFGDPESDYIKGAYNGTLLATGEEQRRQLVAGTEKVAGVPDDYNGIAYTIDPSNLFKPQGTEHNYHPLPVDWFDNPFPYNNGARDVKTFSAGDGFGNTPTWGTAGDNRPQGLVLEYRVRVVDPNDPPATGNGFTFAVGILSSALPRFRVYSIGAGCQACCTDTGACKTTCFTAFGPALSGLDGQGGTPLEPDRITGAAGPAPAPPGLNCFCLRPPQNPTASPAGCVDQTPESPTIDQVALGSESNPGNNNFGDNSRYFMVFNYVKRESTIRSPFVRIQPSTESDPDYQLPIFDPPLSELPIGTSFDIRFRASTGGLGGFDATEYVAPRDIELLNDAAARPFIQFEVVIEGNTSTQLTPVMDEIVIPFRTGP